MRKRVRLLAGIPVTCAMTVAWSARVHPDVAVCKGVDSTSLLRIGKAAGVKVTESLSRHNQ